MVGRLLSYWKGNFSGAMLVSGRVFLGGISTTTPFILATMIGILGWMFQEGLDINVLVQLLVNGVFLGVFFPN